MADMKAIIRVDNLSKKFKLYRNPLLRALEWVTFGRKQHHQEFWALRNISFEVNRGECFGIIGPNGAGKTTLLKLLTRTLYPSGGGFEIQGRVLSLLELGTGFNAELTGRQNLYNSARLLGLPDEYLEDRIVDIEAFAELGDFLDRPIKIYSSGMYVRLAFSLFVFMEPDVLIIDEALSVGDVFFQQKCFAKIHEIISSGTTCLFVSHDMAAVQNLCGRAILLRAGEISFDGDAVEAVSRHYGSVGKRVRGNCVDAPHKVKGSTPFTETGPELINPDEIIEHNILGRGKNKHGAGGLKIASARVTDDKGRDTMQVEMLGSLTFHIIIKANELVSEPSAGIHLFDRLGNVVFATGTRQLGKQLPDLFPGEELILKMKLKLNVQPGEYTFSLGVSEPSEEENPNICYLQDRHDMLGPIIVTTDPAKLLPFYGIARLPIEVTYSRSNRKTD